MTMLQNETLRAKVLDLLDDEEASEEILNGNFNIIE